jgi:hypothetical protein
MDVPLPGCGFHWRYDMLSPKRDLTAASYSCGWLFLRLALSETGGKMPRLINVD